MLADNNLRSQLEKVEEETGKRPAQLDAGGEMPDAFNHIWDWFLDLASVRVEHRPITNAELLAYFELRGIDPLLIEIEALQILDREWILHKANTLK